MKRQIGEADDQNRAFHPGTQSPQSGSRNQQADNTAERKQPTRSYLTAPPHREQPRHANQQPERDGDQEPINGKQTEQSIVRCLGAAAKTGQ